MSISYVRGQLDELSKLCDSLDLIVQEEKRITSFYLEWKKAKTLTLIIITANNIKWGRFLMPCGSSIPQNFMAYDEPQTDCMQNV